MNDNGFTMNEYARRFLSGGIASHDVALPPAINVALQNVFTKVRDGENVDKNKFRKYVIQAEINYDSPNKYVVKAQYKNVIYNSLCLLYLIGTGETKKLFQRYYEAKDRPEKVNLTIFEKQSDRQYLEFFCLGVVRENIDKITTCISSNEFDLFTDKLPSPFSSNANNGHDLSPMLQLFEQEVPWKEYMQNYEKAERFFENKEINKAKVVLQKLEQNALLRLPVVETLNRRIRVEEAEMQEAWGYLQKILN